MERRRRRCDGRQPRQSRRLAGTGLDWQITPFCRTRQTPAAAPLPAPLPTKWGEGLEFGHSGRPDLGAEAATLPSEVLLPNDVEEANIIKQWLASRNNSHKVELLVPRRGANHDLVEMAAENATDTLNSLRARWQADTHKQAEALG